MEFLVVGSEENLDECRVKFGVSHSYLRTDHRQVEKLIKTHSIVFDFDARDISIYRQKGKVIFLNTSTSTLAALIGGIEIQTPLVGFCGLPTFLDREILELTVLQKEQHPALEEIASQLNTKFNIVEDRVGMVTPRIICMIINEAYFAIEENVASRADIDLAMKLGTNYPFGPFEWSQKIGVNNVYQLLKAVYEDTKDERYKISPLLESEAKSFLLKSQRR